MVERIEESWLSEWKNHGGGIGEYSLEKSDFFRNIEKVRVNGTVSYGFDGN